MLPVDLNPHMQLLGLILTQKNEEDLEELLSRGRVRQVMADAVIRSISAIWGNRSEIKSELLALSDANRALEARVLELERHFAATTATSR
jgi:hypothetical protein